MSDVLAVQLVEGGLWHATSPGGRITGCGSKMAERGWYEYKDADHLTTEARCNRHGCMSRWPVNPEGLTRVAFDVCAPCLRGDGGECHTPGCTYCTDDAPVGTMIPWLKNRIER